MNIGQLIKRVEITFETFSRPDCNFTRLSQQCKLLIWSKLIISYNLLRMFKVCYLLKFSLNLYRFDSWLLRESANWFNCYLTLTMDLSWRKIYHKKFMFGKEVVIISGGDIFEIDDRLINFDGAKRCELCCHVSGVYFAVDKQLIRKCHESEPSFKIESFSLPSRLVDL